MPGQPPQAGRLGGGPLGAPAAAGGSAGGAPERPGSGRRRRRHGLKPHCQPPVPSALPALCLPPSYTLRPNCRGSRATSGPMSGKPAKSSKLVWEILKIDSRIPNFLPRSRTPPAAPPGPSRAHGAHRAPTAGPQTHRSRRRRRGRRRPAYPRPAVRTLHHPCVPPTCGLGPGAPPPPSPLCQALQAPQTRAYPAPPVRTPDL
jgi:hypothetical protein